MTGIGTIVNVGAIVAGAGIGMLLGARLPQKISEIAMQALGGVTLLVGLQMALVAQTSTQVIVVLLALVLGSVLGEMLDIEGWLARLGERLERSFAARGESATGSEQAAVASEPASSGSVLPVGTAGEGAGSNFVRSFVAASLLFCVGPMAVLGSFQDGLQGDASLLFTKSALDGISSLAIAAALGPGAMLSALSVGIYQGILTGLAGVAKQIMTDPVVAAVTACGGIMVVGIAVNIWNLKKLRVGNMLPALLLSGVFAALAARLGW